MGRERVEWGTLEERRGEGSNSRSETSGRWLLGAFWLVHFPLYPPLTYLVSCLSSRRSIDIANAGTDAANVTLWAYSPAGDAMDLRHYSTIDHEFVPILPIDVFCGPHLTFLLPSRLNLAYEDNPDPSVTSTPVGMARSYEVLSFNVSVPTKKMLSPFFSHFQISLLALSTTPSHEALSEASKTASTPPALFSTPEFYASHQLFGNSWAVADQSVELEQKQEKLLDFYVKEVESRKWYGFWDFGDVMHTYDK